MNNNAISTICKTVLLAVLIYTSGTAFMALFGMGLWPIALLLLLLILIGSTIYFIVYLIKIRGYKKLTNEVIEMKEHIEKLEKKIQELERSKGNENE